MHAYVCVCVCLVKENKQGGGAAVGEFNALGSRFQREKSITDLLRDNFVTVDFATLVFLSWPRLNAF